MPHWKSVTSPRSRTQAYLLAEINDYLRAFPAQTEAVHRTLSSYDRQAFVPPGDSHNAPAGRCVMAPLTQAMDGQVTIYAAEQSSYKDGLCTEQWIAAQCGMTDVQAILPECWRS